MTTLRRLFLAEAIAAGKFRRRDAGWSVWDGIQGQFGATVSLVTMDDMCRRGWCVVGSGRGHVTDAGRAALRDTTDGEAGER